MSVGQKDRKSQGKRKIEGSSLSESTVHKKAKNLDKEPKKNFSKTKKFEKHPSKNVHQTNPPEKQNWSELKKKKKELKVQRKKDRFSDEKLYEVDLQAKKVYEELKM